MLENFRANVLNTYMGLPEIAMNDFGHTQWLTFVVIVTDRKTMENEYGSSVFLWGERCVKSQKIKTGCGDYLLLNIK